MLKKLNREDKAKILTYQKIKGYHRKWKLQYRHVLRQ